MSATSSKGSGFRSTTAGFWVRLRRAERLRLLGYSNVEVKTGDGGAGWPEIAPFDVILVAAGAPAAPETLKRQLKIGGRLVARVGADLQDQRLLRLIRTGENVFAQDDFGAVTFVPMIGEHGWPPEVGPTGPFHKPPRGFKESALMPGTQTT
jgi:hypothetical protein